MKDLIFILSILSSAGGLSQNIVGVWRWQSNNGNHMSIISIFFSQEEDIIGNYCSAFFDGSKVDCEKEEDKFSLYLIQTDKNIYEGKFTSNSFGGTGILKIDYNQENDVLIFKVLSGTGEYYLPKEAIFKR